MKTAIAIAAAGLTLAFAAPVAADHHTGMKAEVVERSGGKATKVSIGGKVYDVCTAKDQDGCINPREAGLNWGNRALNCWPGQAVSEGGPRSCPGKRR